MIIIEHYLKFFGMAAIFFLCTYIGFFMAEKLKKRYKSLMELEGFVVNLRGEISYKNTVLEDAFCNSRDKVSGQIQSYIDKISENIVNDRKKSMSILAKDEGKILKKSALTESDIGDFTGFIGSMGQLDKQMQLSVIDMYIEKLKISKDESKDEINRSSKMYKCMGAFVGIMICIFMF